MYKFHLPKDLVIIDVETSGVNPETASIIQIGAVIFNKDGYLEKGLEGADTRYLITPPMFFSEYIKPYTNEWEEGAYQVHQIERAFLEQNGKDLETVLQMFEIWLSPIYNDIKKKYWIGQWGCGFDTDMLKTAYKKIGREYPFHYRSFDIASIVRIHLAKKGKLYMKCGMNKCANALGIEVKETRLHDAYYDAYLSGLLLEKVIKGGIDEKTD